MTESVSRNVIYKIKSAKSGTESANSLIAGDMSSKLLSDHVSGNVAIIDGDEDK